MILRRESAVVTLLLGLVFSSTSCIMINSEPEKVTAALININNLIEIEEGVQLDEYGYNRREAEVSEGKVKRNESLYLILRDMDVSPQVIQQINQKSQGIFQSNRVKPGQRFLTYSDKSNEKPVRLILHQNALDYIVFDWEDEISIVKGQKEITTTVKEVSGVIRSSLYETLLANEQSTLLGNRLSEIFAWQIDFFRLYPGDNYKVIYEQQYVEGQPFGLGKVLAAEFTNKGKAFDAYFFENEERSAYYDSEGNGVQKALLKAPFKFSQRISSNFSHNRFHPVLKRNVPHYGVDYAAPLGTPVLSVGDGEVIESQYRGANGNIVKIRHNSTYTTAYLHLNGFAKGIRKGARVKQGQEIGYVGKTGRVTGVHLDYRVYKNGQPVNPLKIDLPPSKSIDEASRDAFLLKVEELQEVLNSLGENNSTVAMGKS